MITSASECTINQYIKCRFDGKYNVLGEGSETELKEAFYQIETEYIDLSGQYESGDYESIKSIISLGTRIKHIELLLFINQECIKEFNSPWLPSIVDFKKYGYNLTWNKSIDDFLAQLQNVESSEKIFIVELEIAKSKLKKPDENEETKTFKRADFIKMIINLQKLKYIIDRDKTTMEEFAIMVGEAREEMIANDLKPE